MHGSADLELYERAALPRLVASPDFGGLADMLETGRAAALGQRAEKTLSMYRILPIHEF